MHAAVADPNPVAAGGLDRLRAAGVDVTLGTLADEAMLLAAPVLGDVRSNTPLRPDLDLGTDLSASGHVVVDFGDDALTVGRAHPMIDPTLRLEAIAGLAAGGWIAGWLARRLLGQTSRPGDGSERAGGASGDPSAARLAG